VDLTVAQQLVDSLAAEGVSLLLNGHSLGIKASSPITEQKRDALRRLKPQIVALLAKRDRLVLEEESSEFERLLHFLTPLEEWADRNVAAWHRDFAETPWLVLEVLRDKAISWQEGRSGVI